MARNIVAFIVGITVSGLIVASIEMANHNLHALPPDLNLADREAMEAFIKTLPPLAFIVVLIAHLLGVIGGSWVACIVAHNNKRNISLGIGIFMLIMGIITLIMTPHPLWFVIADILVYIPGAILGYTLYNIIKDRRG